jgi:hypothetical protein
MIVIFNFVHCFSTSDNTIEPIGIWWGLRLHEKKTTSAYIICTLSWKYWIWGQAPWDLQWCFAGLDSLALLWYGLPFIHSNMKRINVLSVIFPEGFKLATRWIKDCKFCSKWCFLFFPFQGYIEKTTRKVGQKEVYVGDGQDYGCWSD